MKLYEVPRKTRIMVDEPGSPLHEQELNFGHVDGMYSYCLDDYGNVIHLAANTNVVIIRSEE